MVMGRYTNKLLLLLLTAGIGAAIQGCKDPCSKGIKHISDDLLSHYNYKTGTYWIYRDSATGTTDSVYVSGADAATQCYDAEYVTLQLSGRYLFSPS
ncbi:MAG: hypothetical protein EBZ77_17370, partial [Chitinophagia bacterium]|nr:hypothetical protein [Chitinophagia bacterium]